MPRGSMLYTVIQNIQFWSIVVCQTLKETDERTDAINRIWCILALNVSTRVSSLYVISYSERHSVSTLLATTKCASFERQLRSTTL